VRDVAPGIRRRPRCRNDVTGMKRSSSGRISLLAGGALALLVVLWCAPSAARAGCGDYIVTSADQHGNPMPPAKPAPADPHKPCSGPHCSQAPAVPFGPAPTVTPPGGQEWGCPVTGPDSPTRGHVALLMNSPAARPTRLASSVFHPPRPAA
jgi:hypothetical protein